MVQYPLVDPGTPEEEAWRWKILPMYIRHMRLRQTYLYTVKYYDKPEGEDLLGKLVASNRLMFPYAFVFGTMDACMINRKTGVQARLGRMLHFLWPAVGATCAFTTVTYFGAKLRQKDDYWNYAAGAIAAGSVVGKWQKCHVTGWVAALGFCFVAGIQRIKLNEGWTWWNFEEHDSDNHKWHKYKWDIYRDPLPKNYTTSTEVTSNSQ